MTADTVSGDGFTPHEYETEDAGDDRRIHRCDDESAIEDIGSYAFEDARDGYHLRSLHRADIGSEKKEAVDDEYREEYPDTPGKSFLYRPDPDFVSFREEESHEWSKYTPSWTDEDFQYEIRCHETHEDERDIELCLEKDEKEWKVCHHEGDPCRDADFALIDEAVCIIFAWEVLDVFSVHRNGSYEKTPE